MDENVAYSAKAERGEARTLLQPATALLKETLGPSWPHVQVAWDQEEDDRGRTLYTLRLRDFAGATEARFAPEELTRPTHMRFRLAQAWGRLLQIRNHVQMQQLKEVGAED